MSNVIKTSVATIKKSNDYLIEIDYHNESDVELQDAKTIHQAFLKLSNNKPFTLLIEGRNKFVNFSDEAKKFYANDKEVVPLKIAMAMVIDTLPARIIGKFYLSLYKPKYKTKIFSKREQAIEWLGKMYKDD